MTQVLSHLCTSTFSPSVPTRSNSVANNTNFLISFQFDPLASMNQSAVNPFILNLKSPRVRVRQSCRENFDGPNDTTGLAARAERRRC